MKRRRSVALIVGIFVLLTLGGLYEYSTHVVRGWLRGDAFFLARPTSYWRSVVEHDLHCDARDLANASRARAPANWWHSVKERLHLDARPRSSLDLASWSISMTDAEGNPSERALVLKQLECDPNDNIAGFARDAADCTPSWAMWDVQWLILIEKHSFRNR